MRPHSVGLTPAVVGKPEMPLQLSIRDNQISAIARTLLSLFADIFRIYCILWRRLHMALGHVPPLLQMAGHRGTVSRRTANKKLTKLY